jgi:hypothetical protein
MVQRRQLTACLPHQVAMGERILAATVSNLRWL